MSPSLTGTVAAGKNDFPEVPEQGGDTDIKAPSLEDSSLCPCCGLGKRILADGCSFCLGGGVGAGIITDTALSGMLNYVAF